MWANKVNPVNIDREFAKIGDEITAEVNSTLRSGRFILGPKCSELERKLADYCETNYAVTVANGTDALRLSLIAAGISPGQNVVVPDFTFAATAEAPKSIGANVISIPVNKTTYQMNMGETIDSLPDKISAIMPVNLFGLMYWPQTLGFRAMDTIIIEDAAQSIGARCLDRGIGSFSAAATLSFYPTKTLGCYGDGGAVVTNDRYIASEVALLRDHHMSSKYIHSSVGYNSRLDEIQAAILLVKMKYLDEWILRKREIANMYNERLCGLPISCPVEPDDCYHTYHQYTIRTKGGIRESLIRFLSENGIGASVYYPVPIRKMKCLTDGDSVGTESVCDTVVSLPICAHLSNEEVNHVIETMYRFYEAGLE